jgi:hypothetical protein
MNRPIQSTRGQDLSLRFVMPGIDISHFPGGGAARIFKQHFSVCSVMIYLRNTWYVGTC